MWHAAENGASLDKTAICDSVTMQGPLGCSKGLSVLMLTHYVAHFQGKRMCESIPKDSLHRKKVGHCRRKSTQKESMGLQLPHQTAVAIQSAQMYCKVSSNR